ncbi:uncharacterized Fe-S center protein [Moorella thermoacetica Y72]|uniref:Uncharacterized Fe-S center protein n=2 Tax=Neomoorella thermoacetica TaxID=1525 RepID=A0A0S6UFP3_NEOTH|nr:uncharacterized Fe-S center protein [Moorella thermoacetica Y72]
MLTIRSRRVTITRVEKSEKKFKPKKGEDLEMKRGIYIILLSAILLFFLITGCGTNFIDSPDKSASESKTSQTASNNAANESQAGTDKDEARGETPKVYMTTDISPKGLMAIYKALSREATGKVAVKIHTGEPGGTNFLSPDLIKDLVQYVNGTIVECNTAYGGSRASTAMHRQVAKDHGFTAIADVDIMDADGTVGLPVTNGKHLREDIVGSHYKNYDFFIILSHFKGHAMAGFGGAIKNMSIGIASAGGKVLIHTAGVTDKTSDFALSFKTPQEAFLESMAEAAKAVADDLGDNILYINVMNRLSVDCDCDSSPAEPDMHDIGILGSLDPVALDKACVDLVYSAPDGQSLVERIESRNGIHTLDYAEEIGLGSQVYQLVRIDD